MANEITIALTKKEEIARFNKARTDTEFAKLLKVRTLGPEYLEIQSQLRRDIRVCIMTAMSCGTHVVDRPFVIECRNWKITCKRRRGDFKNSKLANQASGKFIASRQNYI